jgi:nickel-dependent lactate racemase
MENLIYLGKTSRGSDISINRHYIESDLKILTGLVESHFMAGASGGRKSICPGLIGEHSTFIFHGAPMLENDNVRDLSIEGNPCHEESLEMALAAGADFIVNVTLDQDFQITGVFAGHLEEAHRAAVEYLKSYTIIPVKKKYDIVLTHAGFVGINHYQAAKAGVEASHIVKDNGYVLMVGDNTEKDPVGTLSYRTMLQLLKLTGSESFKRTILSSDWTFIPEQWQVQMWDRLFQKIPQSHFYYYSPQFTDAEYRIVPGLPLTNLIEARIEDYSIPKVLSLGLEGLLMKVGSPANLSIAYLSSGPYGIPSIMS